MVWAINLFASNRRSQYYCNMQPHYNFHIHWQKDALDEPKVTINSYAGVPTLFNPEHPDHYNYSVPGVWNSTFTGCQWTQDKCVHPLSSKDSWLLDQSLA